MTAFDPDRDNPYASPVTDVTPIEEEASLSRVERRTLLYYQRIRRDGPSMLTVIGVYLVRWLLVAVACAGGVVAYSYLTPGVATIAVAVSVGVVLGLILADTSHWRSFVQIWPRLREIIDWEKLDQILHPDKDAPTVPSGRSAIPAPPTAGISSPTDH